MNPHPYKLRPYHNPEGVDEAKVPDGWRFRYADEMTTPASTFCRAWAGPTRFCRGNGFAGTASWLTYIVPVNP